MFEAGDTPQGSLGEWLVWADIDIDSAADREPNMQWVPETNQEMFEDNGLTGPWGFQKKEFPYPRTSGEQHTLNPKP